MQPVALNVVATKRSGHHAFIEWFLANSRAPFGFRNNLPLDRRYGFKMRAAAHEGRGLIVNYEGVTEAGLARAQAAQRDAGFAPESVVFLRDPMTVIASLMHRKPMPALTFASLGRQMEALRVWLLARREDRIGVRHVSYNHWLRDAAYRGRVACAFGLSAGDPPARVTREGGGSSFGDADATDVAGLTSRWRRHADDPLFRAVVGHPIYRDVFAATYEGRLRDSFGGDFRDDEARAFLEACWSQARASRVHDRLIETLHQRTDLLEAMERRAGRRRRIPTMRLWAAAIMSSGSLPATSAGADHRQDFV
jgi:hypothetical protein